MRLATFNILHGRGLSDGRVDLDRFGAAVAALDADVVALQEVDRDQPRSHQADLTAVAAEAMGARHHRFVATLHGHPGTWTAATGEDQPEIAAYGIALLSRLPVRQWKVLALPTLPTRVPMVHRGNRRPSLVRDEQRAALAAVVETGGGPLTVVATHLTFIPGWNALQLRRLVRVCRPLPRPLAVTGDLNLEGAAPARISRWRSAGRALTFPVQVPDRQIDHVLLDGAVRPSSEPIAVDTGMSDHRALVVDLAVG
ncbi:endonuclease/exonuclease/phosphatase family protein [Cellulomonas denverensis]|uniref:Endonuclease n=1 Tax=Cellulomonas denverensis TaxID=264297 RepID=A0A7X6QXP0_9CELL|nr:endonuclease/exonuclease/phosphatase family protein [Cellulomonas denverensis]NKY21352.1 endonuclease [Cellulomonas denverensis]GIG27326.1 endonuclease/exonuclease/phosphatase [Cellulomonas denverensis]